MRGDDRLGRDELVPHRRVLPRDPVQGHRALPARSSTPATTLPTDWSAYEPYQTEINLSTVPEEKILALRKKAYRRFYLEPEAAVADLQADPAARRTMLPYLTLLFARRAYAR